MVGFGETYFSAYALYLGANNFQMGVLTCLPPFLANLCQFYTPYLLEKYKSRKKLVLTGVMLQAISLLPFIFAYYFSFLKIEIYILLVTLYFATNSTIGPVWNSWMGELVDANQRGSYFGRRNKMITIGTFLSMSVAGFLLRRATKEGHELYGFIAIIILAFASRLSSFYFLSKKEDIVTQTPVIQKESFLKFCKNLPQKNYGILIISMVTVTFGVYLAAAYYTPHLLKNLKLDYLTYTIIISAVLLFKYFSSGFWGEVIDMWGSKKVVVLTSLLICFTTWPWFLTESLTLIFVAQCYTGIVWAGYELATFTFLLDATKPEERTYVISFYNILNSSMGFIGGVIGAIWVAFYKDSFFAFKVLFLTTSLIRLTSYFIFSTRIKEVKVLAPVKASEVFIKASGFKSTLGLMSRLIILDKKKK
ncbi:MAG: MFS transporter [Oligoflexia bacterium]|nr:MFS transporter [Oligoflexia bacterium]